MSKKTISQALKDLFLNLGGDSSALADNTTASDYIQDLESAIKANSSALINDDEASESSVYSSSKVEDLIERPLVIVEPEIASVSLFGTAVSAMQTGVCVTDDGYILGSLKKLTSGQLVDRWGEGCFLALKFIITDSNVSYNDIEVTSSSGNLIELDEDLNGAFRIGDNITETYTVKVTVGEIEKTYTYDLTKLTLEE